MSEPLFDCRLLRSMRLDDGRTAVRGALLRLPADHAARLLREGAVVLCDERDLQALRSATVNGAQQ